jgi:hypothetical protein
MPHPNQYCGFTSGAVKMNFLFVIWHTITTWGGLLFVVGTALFFWLSPRLTQRASGVKDSVTKFLWSVVAAAAYLGLIMLQYYALTGHILWQFAALEIFIVLAVLIMGNIYDGLFQFASDDDRSRLEYFSYISVSWFQVIVSFFGSAGVIMLVWIVSWYFALAHFAFDSNPVDRDAHVLVLVAILPVVLAQIPAMLLRIGHILTADIDNAVRNKLASLLVLDSGFAVAALLALPHYLYRGYFEQHFGPYLGGSYPAASFLALSAAAATISFVIGLLRHAAQRRRFQEIERDLVAQARALLAIPPGNYREQERHVLLDRIVGECERSATDRPFYEFYFAHLVLDVYGFDRERWDAMLMLPLSDNVIDYLDKRSTDWNHFVVILGRWRDRIDSWDIKAAHIHFLMDIFVSIAFPSVMSPEHVLDHQEKRLGAAAASPTAAFHPGLAVTAVVWVIGIVFRSGMEGAFEGAVSALTKLIHLV